MRAHARHAGLGGKDLGSAKVAGDIGAAGIEGDIGRENVGSVLGSRACLPKGNPMSELEGEEGMRIGREAMGGGEWLCVWGASAQGRKGRGTTE